MDELVRCYDVDADDYDYGYGYGYGYVHDYVHDYDDTVVVALATFLAIDSSPTPFL